MKKIRSAPALIGRLRCSIHCFITILCLIAFPSKALAATWTDLWNEIDKFEKLELPPSSKLDPNQSANIIIAQGRTFALQQFLNLLEQDKLVDQTTKLKMTLIAEAYLLQSLWASFQYQYLQDVPRCQLMLQLQAISGRLRQVPPEKLPPSARDTLEKMTPLESTNCLAPKRTDAVTIARSLRQGLSSSMTATVRGKLETHLKEATKRFSPIDQADQAIERLRVAELREKRFRLRRELEDMYTNFLSLANDEYSLGRDTSRPSQLKSLRQLYGSEATLPENNSGAFTIDLSKELTSLLPKSCSKEGRKDLPTRQDFDSCLESFLKEGQETLELKADVEAFDHELSRLYQTK